MASSWSSVDCARATENRAQATKRVRKAMGKESGSDRARRIDALSVIFQVITTPPPASRHHRRRRRRRRQDCDHYLLALSMTNFLTRKKNRPRQSSVSTASELGASKPYEELAPSPRSPIHVGTTSQALRGSVPSVISAPITNPTLTTDGTELNIFTMHRSKQEREQLYASHPTNRPNSPLNSPSTADSSTIYSESDKTYSHHRSTTSVSETSVSSGRMSPSVSDFGGYHAQRKGSNQQTTRPTSRATARSERMSMNTRSIVSDSLSQHHHSTHIGNALHVVRHGMGAEEFYFPRPNNDEEIEALFQDIKRSLDLGDNMPNMTIDQKWQMVYNAEHLRWAEERRREQQTKKQVETGQSVSFAEGSPEWYIQRFMERTITPKQASSLEVSLRSNQLRSISPQRSPPFVAEDLSAGSSTSFQYKALLCSRKPLHKYQGRATRGD